MQHKKKDKKAKSGKGSKLSKEQEAKPRGKHSKERLSKEKLSKSSLVKADSKERLHKDIKRVKSKEKVAIQAPPTGKPSKEKATSLPAIPLPAGHVLSERSTTTNLLDHPEWNR